MVKHGVCIQFNKMNANCKTCTSYFSTTHRFNKPEFVLNYMMNDVEEFLEIFVHEYCHFLQWCELSSIYKKANSSLIQFDSWLCGEDVKFSIADIRNIQSSELDCDFRAIQLIKEYGLNIDIDHYIKRSNSYALSYNYVYEFRNFKYVNKSGNSEALAHMPTTFFTVEDLAMISNEEHRKFVCDV